LSIARSATFESIAVETVKFVIARLLLFSAAIVGRPTVGKRLEERQSGESAIELRRKRAETASVVVARWRVRILEVAPSLMRSTGSGSDPPQLGRTDDVDPAVLAIFKP
jgi:hypothetical protein